jgi:hypothetical protein
MIGQSLRRPQFCRTNSKLFSALGPQNGGPNWETNEARGGGSCTGPVEVNRGPRMTSGLVRLIGGCTLYRLGRPRISLRPLSSPSVPHHLYRGGRNLKGFAPNPWRMLCARPQIGGPKRK